MAHNQEDRIAALETLNPDARLRVYARSAVGTHFEKRLPTDDHIDFAGWWVIIAAEEVEAASVGRDVVLSSPVPEADRRNLELDRQSESRRPIGCPAHRRTAEPPVRVDEEKLGAVAAPDWLITAITGDNTACGWTGDAAHRHLWSS
jgi:hypothetical protein